MVAPVSMVTVPAMVPVPLSVVPANIWTGPASEPVTTRVPTVTPTPPALVLTPESVNVPGPILPSEPGPMRVPENTELAPPKAAVPSPGRFSSPAPESTEMTLPSNASTWPPAAITSGPIPLILPARTPPASTCVPPPWLNAPPNAGPVTVPPSTRIGPAPLVPAGKSVPVVAWTSSAPPPLMSTGEGTEAGAVTPLP